MLDFATTFETILHVHAEYYFNGSVAQAQFRHARKKNTLLPFTKSSQMQ